MKLTMDSPNSKSRARQSITVVCGGGGVAYYIDILCEDWELLLSSFVCVYYLFIKNALKLIKYHIFIETL
jgi:hypothetical protein